MKEEFRKYITTFRFTRNTISGIIMGISLLYILEEKSKLHLPCVVLCPAIYMGYQSYKNRDRIRDFIKK